MNYDRLKDTAFSRSIADVASDFASLFQAEVRLAKAEISVSIREKSQAAIWFGAAGMLALVALVFVGQAIAGFLILKGLEVHWSNLVVAAAFVILVGICVAVGLSKARHAMTLDHTVQQIRQDIGLAKEQLS